MWVCKTGAYWRTRNFRVTNATTLLSTMEGVPVYPSKEVGGLPPEQMIWNRVLCLADTVCMMKGLELTNLAGAEMLTFNVFLVHVKYLIIERTLKEL